jgi:hypothetical protein
MSESTYKGGASITRSEFEALRRRDCAGLDPDGSAWVLFRNEQYGTCLVKGIRLEPPIPNDCEFCGRSFKTQHALREHRRAKHLRYDDRETSSTDALRYRLPGSFEMGKRR